MGIGSDGLAGRDHGSAFASFFCILFQGFAGWVWHFEGGPV
jgi:hypothetical protein